MITSIRTQRLTLRLPNKADAPALFHTINGSVATLSRSQLVHPGIRAVRCSYGLRGAEYDAAQGLGFPLPGLRTAIRRSHRLLRGDKERKRSGEDGVWNLAIGFEPHLRGEVG